MNESNTKMFGPPPPGSSTTVGPHSTIAELAAVYPTGFTLTPATFYSNPAPPMSLAGFPITPFAPSLRAKIRSRKIVTGDSQSVDSGSTSEVQSSVVISDTPSSQNKYKKKFKKLSKRFSRLVFAPNFSGSDRSLYKLRCSSDNALYEPFVFHVNDWKTEYYRLKFQSQGLDVATESEELLRRFRS